MRVAVTSCPLSAAALHKCLIDLVVTVSPRQPRASRRPPCWSCKSAQIDVLCGKQTCRFPELFPLFFPSRRIVDVDPPPHRDPGNGQLAVVGLQLHARSSGARDYGCAAAVGAPRESLARTAAAYAAREGRPGHGIGDGDGQAARRRLDRRCRTGMARASAPSLSTALHLRARRKVA